MNELLLYNKNGVVLFSIDPEESSSHDWSLMSDNKLSISFEREVCSVLAPGCYVEFDGIRYYLLDEYKPRMINSFTWKYDVTFLDAASWMSVVLAMNTLDGKNIPIFNYTGPAREHAAIIVANLNRHMGTTEWKVGSVIDTLNIAIEYRGKYCSQILQEIVDGQDTEWWVDGMTLNIGRAEFGDPVELGYRNGLLGDISREQAAGHRAYAYLVPIGSTRNIDPTKYGYDRLQLPDGQMFVDINPDGVGELIEERAFAEIYPRYEGTVQYVRSMPATGADGNEFIIYYIGDMLPFDPNDYEIAGLVKRITFQSGELMGESFEVNYNAEAQEFEIITQFPNGGAQLPGGIFTPAAGDKYVIWNITMPDEYYALASQEYLEAAEAFAESSVQDSSVYKGSLDYIDIQTRGISVRPGRRVRLLSDEYFSRGYYDSRITRMTRRLWYPNEISIDVSAVRVVGSIARLETSIQKTETQLSQLSGAQPAIIKSGEITPPSDKTVYSSAKCEEEFLSKRKGGIVKAVTRFEKGIAGAEDAILYFDKEHKCWVFTHDVLIEGGVASFSKISEFTPSTVMDAVKVDNDTISKVNGVLKVSGAGIIPIDNASLVKKENEDGSYVIQVNVAEPDKYIPVDGETIVFDKATNKLKAVGASATGCALIYDKDKKCWLLEGDLLVTGGLSTFSNIEGFTPSTIMDAIKVDGTTISKAGGVLAVVGGGAGGNVNIPTALPNPEWLLWYNEDGGLEWYSGSESKWLPNFSTLITKDKIVAKLGYTPYDAETNSKGFITVTDIPTPPEKLPNPSVLRFGTKTYDGSVDVTLLASDLNALTSHQSIFKLSFSAGKFSVVVFTANKASASVNIPTQTSHLTNDSDFATNKNIANTYLPKTGGTIDGPLTVEDKLTAKKDLDIYGDLAISGHIASLTTSDERLKENVRTFSATEILQSMGGVKQYEYTEEEVKRNPANAGTHIGFIYQNVEKSQMADKMCCKRVDDYGALNYLSSDYQALLAAVILEQADKIKRLEEILSSKTA